MIRNLPEFLNSCFGLGTEVEANSMYQCGHALNKAEGFWVSFLVEVEPAVEIDYSIIIRKNPLGQMLIERDCVPMLVLDFFGLQNGGKYLDADFDDYYHLLMRFESNSIEQQGIGRNFNVVPGENENIFIIEGKYFQPRQEREVYYNSDDAKESSHMLSDSCIGIRVDSIIEGAHYDATPFTLYFPFSEETCSGHLDELKMEVENEWELNNQECED